MNRTRTMGLAGALMLGGPLGAGTPAVRAQTYADPAGGTYYSPAPAPVQPGAATPSGYSAYPGPDYPPAALTTAASTPAPVDNSARTGTLEERIRALESRLRGTGDSGGTVIDFIDERGW